MKIIFANFAIVELKIEQNIVTNVGNALENLIIIVLGSIAVLEKKIISNFVCFYLLTLYRLLWLFIS